MADSKVVAAEKPVDAKTAAADKPKEEKIIVPNFISRIKISNSYTSGKITLREYDTIDIVGAPLIQGFPNPTSDNMITGIIITSYIVQHLKLPIIGDLLSQSFPPMAVVKQGAPAPGARIYGNKNLVVIASEYTIKDAEILHDVVQATVELAKRHKLSMVIGLDAVAGNLSESVNLLDQIQIQAANADELGEGDDDDDYEDDDGGEDDAMDAVVAGDQKVGVNQLAAATMSGPVSTSLAMHTSDKKEASKLAKRLGADSKKKDTKKKDESSKKDGKKPKKQDKASAEDEGDEEDDEEDEEEDKIDVWFITNSQLIGDTLKSLAMEPAVEVAINGVQGGLINEARFTDLPIVLMMASLDKLELGARPALVLVEAVQKLLTKLGNTSLGIDLSKLQESTSSLESKIGELMKKMQAQQGPTGEATNKMMYL